MVTVLLGVMEKEPGMKKIAIVLNSAWQAYNFRLNLANYLRHAGYKVTILRQGGLCGIVSYREWNPRSIMEASAVVLPVIVSDLQASCG